jgi:hypothetical protein
MNATYLKDPDVVMGLNREWRRFPAHLNFFGKMRRILEFFGGIKK